MLSAIILNWNRAYLLRQFVDSYLETVAGDEFKRVMTALEQDEVE